MFSIQNTLKKDTLNSIEDNRSNSIKSTNQSICNFVQTLKTKDYFK